jgi:hypothetical protein
VVYNDLPGILLAAVSSYGLGTEGRERVLEQLPPDLSGLISMLVAPTDTDFSFFSLLPPT